MQLVRDSVAPVASVLALAISKGTIKSTEQEQESRGLNPETIARHRLNRQEQAGPEQMPVSAAPEAPLMPHAVEPWDVYLLCDDESNALQFLNKPIAEDAVKAVEASEDYARFLYLHPESSIEVKPIDAADMTGTGYRVQMRTPDATNSAGDVITIRRVFR